MTPTGQARSGPTASKGAQQAEIARAAANPTLKDAMTAAARVPGLRFPDCETCGREIRSHGYARVRIGAAIKRGKAARSLRRDPPPLVPWTFRHASCDPEIDARDSYFVPIKRAWSSRGLLREVMKLSKQRWYEDTAWREMVAAIMAASKRRALHD